MLEGQWAFLGVIASVGASVWSLAWWLNGHFNNIRKDVFDLGKEILSKLEYHERHDDVRFTQIKDDLWDIRVRNAAKDGLISSTTISKERPNLG